MTLSTRRMSAGVPMLEMSIGICIAGESPVRSITPLTGTVWPETSMFMENLAVVIFFDASWIIARKVAPSSRWGFGFEAGDESDVVVAALVGPAWASVAVPESDPQAVSDASASGTAAA